MLHSRVLVGKSVVASRIGVIPEFVYDGQDGFLVPYDQPEAFAERIVYLLQHPDQAKCIRDRAREAVSFLWDGTAVERVIELYRQLAVITSLA